jgi:rubrerythrin
MSRLIRVGFIKFFVLLAAVSFFLVQGGNEPLQAGKVTPGEKETNTIENLLTGYNIESNAYNIYQAFSQKAEKEGYPRIAHLFRAVLRSIKVQMENHAEAVKKMNGTPKSDLKTPMVKSTEENLQIAVKEEFGRYSHLYPAFLKKARRERNKIALRTFNFSKSAAGEHLNFFKEASAHLEGWEKKNRNFLVCIICGNMVTALTFDECPICFNPLEKYVQVK